MGPMFNYFQKKCFFRGFFSLNFTIIFCTKKQDAVQKIADIFYLLPLKLSVGSISKYKKHTLKYQSILACRKND